jgi:hypothetical protein
LRRRLLISAFGVQSDGVQTKAVRSTLERQQPASLVKVFPIVGKLLNSTLDAPSNAGAEDFRNHSDDCFFYPSDGMEHLPNVAARGQIVPIIASTRDFARDVCAPVQARDPTITRAIANAAQRFLDGSITITPCCSTARFAAHLLE